MERKERCQEWPGAAFLPALTPASHGHCSFLCNLFVVCQGKSPLKKKTNVLSFSSFHNGVFMAGIGRTVVGAAWDPCAPSCLFTEGQGTLTQGCRGWGDSS